MSDLKKFILLIIGLILAGFAAGYFTFNKPAPDPIEVYKTKDSLIYITDSAACKFMIELLKEELENCNDEKKFISEALKRRQRLQTVIVDSVLNSEDYSYIKEYKKENGIGK